MQRIATSPTLAGTEPARVDTTPAVARPERKEKAERPARVSQPLKWWGGKYYLAPKIIDRMPKHLHYVEPYFGGGAVLLAKNPLDPRHQWGDKGHEKGTSEVVNDLNGELSNFWRVLQDEQSFAEFQRSIEATPFSQIEWKEAKNIRLPHKMPDVKAAHAFFVRCRQSRAGECKEFAALSRNRTRSRMNEQASAWLNCIAGLSQVHARLKRVVILNDDALNVIRTQDGPKTLFYLDPPYLPSTRASANNYQHDMTEDDHRQLLETIKGCNGKVMLSGYPSELYEAKLAAWKRHEFKIDNKAAGGQAKREMSECVWTNF